ncbi:hypothetical protein QFC24_004994 [Naganishia onofrii]|uniref:Uncharacterized protein n=1 Tax=Naganishia onofrii TaxID=1851511 RepID=A0ACC2XAG7_9TREE|nr:hypothetical protein QFC24_004994 [Naganishia onofrii]
MASTGSSKRTEAQGSSLGQAGSKMGDSTKTSGTLEATSTTPPLTAEDKKAQVLAQKKAFDDRFVSNLHHIEGL